MKAPILLRHGSFKRSRDSNDSPTSTRAVKRSSSYSIFRTPKREPSPKRRSSPPRPSILTSLRTSFGQVTPASTPASIKTKCEHFSPIPYGTPQSPLAAKNPLEREFSDLTLWSPSKSSINIKLELPRKCGTTHPIFQIPEILERILRFVDDESFIPQEKSHHRRRPQSFSHAMLMYHGDAKKATKVWDDVVTSVKSGLPTNTTCSRKLRNLHGCITVNKMWHTITHAIITEKVYFEDMFKFQKFVNFANKGKYNSKPSLIVLHKLSGLTQSQLDNIAPVISSANLKWLELYICPKVVPSPCFFINSSGLEKLILPGSKLITDEFLISVSSHLTNLKILDLRACDKVTDSGVVSIATSCPRLTTCNLGRHRNGHLITSISLIALATHTEIETIGVAGCNVTDAGIWELALLRGAHITRLSLNNCTLLTNHSIPALISTNSFPNLSVLEIRNIHNMTDMRPIVSYKKWKHSLGLTVLIEGCERIEKLLREEEWRLNKENSVSILSDLTQWVNEEDE